jgi:hypothetical protein
MGRKCAPQQSEQGVPKETRLILAPYINPTHRVMVIDGLDGKKQNNSFALSER